MERARSTDWTVAMLGLGMLGLAMGIVSLLLIGWFIVSVPSLFRGAGHRGRQQHTLQAMRTIATANLRYRLDYGSYATRLGDLEPSYIDALPQTDGWGNPWRYEGGSELTLISLGADGLPGPGAPNLWMNKPYEPDLMLQNGQFVQAPTGPSPGATGLTR